MAIFLLIFSYKFLGKEYVDTKKALYRVLDKKQCWGKQVKDKTGNIFWEFQEATNIELLSNEDNFYKEIKNSKIDQNKSYLLTSKNLSTLHDLEDANNSFKCSIAATSCHSINRR